MTPWDDAKTPPRGYSWQEAKRVDRWHATLNAALAGGRTPEEAMQIADSVHGQVAEASPTLPP